MSDRDKMLENQIRNEEVRIPDSLRPENIEEKLARMTPEEAAKRSSSIDIPVDTFSRENAATKKKKSDMNKVVFPIVLAASLMLIFGLGIGISIGRNLNKNNDGYSSNNNGNNDNNGNSGNNTTESTTEKKGLLGKNKKDKNENYSLAYNVLDNYYSKMEEEQNKYIEYDMVEEAETVAETSDEAAAADNSANQSLGAEKRGKNSEATYGKADDDSVSFTDTNVRTEGVGEADIVKTDGKYIYEYEKNTEHLLIYKVSDGKIEKAGSINVLSNDVTGTEMYIQGDKLIFMGYKGTNYYGDFSGETVITIYDISDREKPELDKSIVQDGYYESSRLVNGILYTFTKKVFSHDDMKKKDYETYIPEVDGELVEDRNILVRDYMYGVTYVVISSIDVAKSKVIDSMAALAGNDTLYVSSQNIYLIDRYYDWTRYNYGEDSKIVRISYDDGKLQYENDGDFSGYLNDDYSIDEYDGYVRLVTTYREGGTTYNGLFIMDLDLKKVSVIKKLAENELIRSARFMGKTGYFVTFRNTDPLFAVDLSNPEEPEILDYLKIPGFSAYLHPYGDGQLLGIGYDADEYGGIQSIKLSMFDISDPTDVKEEDKMVLPEYITASVLNDRNAFMFNGEDGTFGFSAQPSYNQMYDEDTENYIRSMSSSYLVFDYDEKGGFEKLMSQQLLSSEMYGSSDDSDVRGIVIGDYLYLVECGYGIRSFDTDDYSLVDEID